MKKTTLLTMAIICILCAFAFANAEDSDILVQAEQILQNGLYGVTLVDDYTPFPADYRLTGPFIYIGSAGDPSKLYTPNESAYDFEIKGLPDGAELFMYDNEKIKNVYEGFSDDSNVNAYAILYCNGYYNGTKYSGDLTVVDKLYTVLYVDYETGNIIASSECTRQYGGPYQLFNKDYHKDENGVSVFNRVGLNTLNDIWIDALKYAAADETGAVIQHGTLISVIGENITEYTVPDGVTTIGERAFFGRDTIERVVLPDSVKHIGSEAFACCYMLSDIVIPDTVVSVGTAAFADTPFLMNIQDEFVIVGDGVLIETRVSDFDESNEMYFPLVEQFGYPDGWDDETRNMISEEYGVNVFTDEVNIPEGVKRISKSGMNGVYARKITLPSTLTGDWAADEAFFNVAVEEIYICDGVSSLPYNVFDYCLNLQKLRLPASIMDFNVFSVSSDMSGMVIICPKDSFAFEVASDMGYIVEAE